MFTGFLPKLTGSFSLYFVISFSVSYYNYNVKYTFSFILRQYLTSSAIYCVTHIIVIVNFCNKPKLWLFINSQPPAATR